MKRSSYSELVSVETCSFGDSFNRSGNSSNGLHSAKRRVFGPTFAAELIPARLCSCLINRNKLERKFFNPVLCVLFLILGIFSLKQGEVWAKDNPQSSEEELVREVYVPYEELLRLSKKDPSGIVMSLEEYRALLELAKKNTPEPVKAKVLPPVGAIAVESKIHGIVRGATAALTAEIVIEVASDDWVRCAIGPQLPFLSSAKLDGETAWLLTERARRGGKRSGAQQSVFIKGKGRHVLKLEFSLPVQASDDTWTLQGALPRAVAGSLVLLIPEKVEGQAQPAFFQQSSSSIQIGEGKQEATKFEIALGSRDSFSLKWKLQRGAARNASILEAGQTLRVFLDVENPTFIWDVNVQVYRERSDRFRFQLPPGFRVLRGYGSLLHTFKVEKENENSAEVLEILLQRPTQGRVSIRFEGLIGRPDPVEGEALGSAYRFNLGRPALLGSVRDQGYLGLHGPEGDEIRISQTTGMVPIDVSTLQTSEVSLAHRAFQFHTPDADVEVDLRPRAQRFEVRSTHRLTLSETGGVLESAFRIHSNAGRLYALNLNLPEGLEWIGLQEANSGKWIKYDPPQGPGAARVLPLELINAVKPGEELVFIAFLRLSRTDGDASNWQSLSFPVEVPSIASASRERRALGIEIPHYLEGTMNNLAGWKPLSSVQLPVHGLNSMNSIASLEHQIPGDDASLTMELRRRPFRGVYQAVAQVLASESGWRMRVDLRLAVTGRPLESLALTLPVDPNTEIAHHVPGLKEMSPEAGSSRRILHFQKAWLGERLMRFEFDVPEGENNTLTIPVIEIAPFSAVPGSVGSFDPNRFVVLGSFGGVGLTVQATDKLMPVDLDSLPAFSTFFKEGRIVQSFRVLEDKPQAEAGTVQRVLYERLSENLVNSGISELALESTIGRDGIIRSVSRFILRYSLTQHLKVELANNEKVVSVSIDDVPVNPVRVDPNTTTNPQELLIPLPPRSYATIVLTTELQTQALNGLGSIQLHGPQFPDLPVGMIDWTLFYPPELKVHLLGPEVDSLAAQVTPTFYETFWKNLLTSGAPKWVSWSDGDPQEAVALSFLGSLSKASLAPSQANPSQVVENQLVSVQQRKSQTEQPDLATLNIPAEGKGIKVRKLGGDAEVSLVYREIDSARFRRRGLFLLGLAGCIVLARKRFRAWLAFYIASGLALATFIPEAFSFDSTLSWTPFGEGIFAGALLVGACFLYRLILRKADGKPSRATEAVMLFILALGAGMLVPDEVRAQKQAVLIPYSLDDFNVSKDPKKKQVWVPYSTFIELWNRAFPTEKVAVEEKVPAAIILGNAAYRLIPSDSHFRLEGELELQVLTDKWTSLPVPVSGAQLSRIELNGKPVGVTIRKGIPTIAFKGKGKYTVKLVLEGKLNVVLGEARLNTQLIPGRATQVTGELAAGLELDPRQGSGGKPLVVTQAADDQPTKFRVDLGQSGAFQLLWRSRVLKAESPQQVSTLSEGRFQLNLDGYSARFHERIQVEGAPLKYARYTIAGNWNVLSVEGSLVGEWNVTTRTAENGSVLRELEIFFTRQANGFDLFISGYAPLTDQNVEPAGLELVGGNRREGYLGLIHHDIRRFPPDVLQGMERATKRDLKAALNKTDQELSAYDRIYRYFGEYSDERLRSVPVSEEGSLESEMIAWISRERVAVHSRVSYSAKRESGPLEYILPLNPGWEVRSVRGNEIRDWNVVTGAQGAELRVHFNRRAGTGTRLEWLIEGPTLNSQGIQAGDTLTVSFPQFQAQSTLRQTQSWAIAATEGIELIQLPTTTFLPLALDRAPRWMKFGEGVTYRMGFRTVRSDATLEIGIKALVPRVRAIATSFFRVAPTHIDVNCRLHFVVTRSGVEQLRLRLPTGGRLIQVGIPGSPSRQSITEDGIQREVLLELPTPTVGNLSVHLSYRIDRPQENPQISLVGPEILGVNGSRSFIAVLQNPARQYSVISEVGLSAITFERLPDKPPVQVSGVQPKIFKAYSVIESNKPLILSEETPQPRQEEEVVELVEIDTVLGADGSNWTVANFHVRNRSRQFIEFRLPAQHSLWRVTVDGENVSVSQQAVEGVGMVILVPVERVLDTDLSLQVRLVYTQPQIAMGGGSINFNPEAPTLLKEASVLQTLWRVHLPEGYEIQKVGGTLSEIIEQARYGEKVKGIVQQIQRIKSASENANFRAKRRALRNLNYLEQALRDNVVEIERERAEAKADEGRVKGEALRLQLEETQSNVVQGLQVQKELEEFRKATQAQGQAGLDPVDQEFEDARGFSTNIWGDGRALTRTRFSDSELPGEWLAPITLPAPQRQPGEAVYTRPNASLKDVSLATSGGSMPLFHLEEGVEITVPKGGHVHTFRRFEGDAKLQLSINHQHRSSGIGAWLGLILCLAGIIAWGRHQVKASYVKASD